MVERLALEFYFIEHTRTKYPCAKLVNLQIACSNSCCCGPSPPSHLCGPLSCFFGGMPYAPYAPWVGAASLRRFLPVFLWVVLEQLRLLTSGLCSAAVRDGVLCLLIMSPLGSVAKKVIFFRAGWEALAPSSFFYHQFGPAYSRAGCRKVMFVLWDSGILGRSIMLLTLDLSWPMPSNSKAWDKSH